ncbi:hypothetical protein AKO1_000149 [Acrasis kona]|uniref:Late embryogenesis abundant protein LEA-2 subgroup domain-containing protein n=1 Tax=Acrasis kona TaxID=1008807 RepID=A0AAW2YQM7_9EUKA
MPTTLTKIRSISLDLVTSTLKLNFVAHMDLTVYNPNRYSVGLSDLNMEVYYWDSKCLVNDTVPEKPREGCYGIDMGNVKYSEKITFPGHSNTTGRDLVLSLYGIGTKPTDWAKLTRDCSILGGSQITLQFIGNTSIYVGVLKVPMLVPISFAEKIYCSK